MTVYARVSDGLVAEIIEIVSPPALEERFHPDVVSAFFAVPDLLVGQVQPGWGFDGDEFSSPPAPPPAPLPDITARQLRLWLLSRGHSLSEVDDAVDGLPIGIREPARVEWEYSTIYQRTHALIGMIGPVLGFSDDEIDAGFVEAAAL